MIGEVLDIRTESTSVFALQIELSLFALALPFSDRMPGEIHKRGASGAEHRYCATASGPETVPEPPGKPSSNERVSPK